MFKTGDLVRCTGGQPKMQRIGVVKKKTRDETYKVFFFNPPDKHWNNGVWFGYAMEKIG